MKTENNSNLQSSLTSFLLFLIGWQLTCNCPILVGFQKVLFFIFCSTHKFFFFFTFFHSGSVGLFSFVLFLFLLIIYSLISMCIFCNSFAKHKSSSVLKLQCLLAFLLKNTTFICWWCNCCQTCLILRVIKKISLH